SDAIERAKQNTTQPTLIEIKTVIGYGSPNKSASSVSHGAPLGGDEVILTKEYYKWEHEPFKVPEAVYEHFNDVIVEKGKTLNKEWEQLFATYEKESPKLASELTDAINNKLSNNWDENLPQYEIGKDELATRVASSDMINALAKSVPTLFGGSADLASSNN